MKPRAKLSVVIGLLAAAILLALYASTSLVILGGFARVEEEDARDNVHRVLDVLSDDLTKLDFTARDWAEWDDTYRFIRDHNRAYVKANLNDPTAARLMLSVMLFVDNSKHTVYSIGCNLKSGRMTAFPASMQRYLAAHPRLLAHPHNNEVYKGIVLLPEGPLLVVCRPILPSNDKGPSRGTLIFGRYLDSDEITRLSHIAHLSLALRRWDERDPPPDFRLARSCLADRPSLLIRPLDADRIAGYAALPDIFGHPALLLRMTEPRDIYRRGQSSVHYFYLCLAAVGLTLGWIIRILFNRLMRSLRRQHSIEQRHRAVVEQASEGVLLIDAASRRIIDANPAAGSLLGYCPQEILERTIYDLVTDPERVDEGIGQLIQGNGSVLGERRYRAKDGSLIEVEINANLVSLEGGECISLIVRDIRERRRAAEALRESEERYALAAQGANDGLWDWDLRTGKVYYSHRWKAMIGCSDDEIGCAMDDWLDRVHPQDVDHVRARLFSHVEGRSSHFEAEFRLRDCDAAHRWMLSRGLAVRDATGAAYRVAGSQTDITDRKRAEEQLRHDALHDSLTGLPNRTLFMERLERALSLTKRYDDYLFAVLFLDLDRFKVVNDGLGHLIGDQLLIAIGRILQQCVRPNDTVARFGGDEFTLLLEDIKDPSDASQVAERIQKELREPFGLSGHEIYTSASIGIALSLTGYDRPDDLMRDADTTMYRAKALGKSRHEVFDSVMRTRAVTLLELESDLRRAVERGEFRVAYQPIVSSETGQIVGCEALTRWQHPQRGLVSPAEFIPLAEETGLIEPIGEWVLRTACAQVKAWQDTFRPDLKIAVNFSARQFLRPDLTEFIGTVLRETGLSPESLEVEITETVAMRDVGHTLEKLRKLCEMGVRISLDDFGTGYCSLGYLKHFPIHKLKIDRSFVTDLSGDADNAAISKMIIGMAHSLNLEVIAEGVETDDQHAFLSTEGCDEMQGFLFSRPVYPESFVERLRGEVEMPRLAGVVR